MIPNIQLTPGFNNISVVKVNQPVFGRKCITSVKCLNCLDFICMRMLTRCLKDASSQPPPEGFGILDCVLKTWSQWQHLWVKGPQLMTMYWNLKTLLGCYHANDGHNWRLLPEVKWERECCPWEKSWQWKPEWKGTESYRSLCQPSEHQNGYGFPTVSEMNEQSVSSA